MASSLLNNANDIPNIDAKIQDELKHLREQLQNALAKILELTQENKKITREKIECSMDIDVCGSLDIATIKQ